MCFKPGFEGCQSESRKTLGKQKVILGACRKTLNVGKLTTMSVRAKASCHADVSPSRNCFLLLLFSNSSCSIVQACTPSFL